MMQTHERVRALRAALERHPEVNLHRSNINLAVQDGVLVLEGEVEDIAAKRIARLVAVGMFGIGGVRDALRVAPAEPRGDGEIAGDLEQALKQELAFRDYHMAASDGHEINGGEAQVLREEGVILATVRDGVVTLTGAVESLTHKRLADVLAWWTRGTRAVVNRLRVVPQERDTDEELTDALRMVLEKDPVLDADQIAVEVKNHKVTLKGAVPGTEQWRMAGRDAWYIRGVQAVDNRLEVLGGAGG